MVSDSSSSFIIFAIAFMHREVAQNQLASD